MKSVVVVFFLAIHCSVIFLSDAYDCKDENNNDVDWFYIYKLPRNKFSKDPLVSLGLAYMYITPQTLKQGWILSTKSMNDSTSIPGLTLAPLYKNDDHVSVIYNDQPFTEKKEKSDSEVTTKLPKENKVTKRKPAKKNSAGIRNEEAQWILKEERRRKKLRNSGDGHTKGVIIGDASTGIWVVHSVPRYPPIPSGNSVHPVKYSYPDTARRYGQSFLCLSLKASSLNQVGQQLGYNEPKILYSNVPQALRDKFSDIVDVINDKTVFEAPWSHVVNISTKKGVQFTSFAKSANFKDDLYEGLVAQSLRSDLFVESWINGPGVLESNCTYKYKVNNVEKVAFQPQGIAFSSHADHSKWAITAPAQLNKKTNSQKWICVGDINRAETQELRGGGTVCTQNSALWAHYLKVINEIEPCKKPT